MSAEEYYPGTDIVARQIHHYADDGFVSHKLSAPNLISQDFDRRIVVCQTAGALLGSPCSSALRIYLQASEDQMHSTIIGKCESETKLAHEFTNWRLLVHSYCVL
jgi:hypothetical protein